MTSLVVISAGLRVPSSSRMLADQLASAAARAFGGASTVSITHVELREHAHAIMDALITGFPVGELADVLESVRSADAVIAVSPTFQASVSGLFKAFVDLVATDDLRGTPVLVAATGGSERHSMVLDHAMRPLFAYLGALVVPTGVYAATSDFGGAGARALSDRIDQATSQLAALAGASSVHRPVVDEYADFIPFDQVLAKRH